MITFGRKLKYLRQKNHLTQKELGMAVGFPDSCADVRIAQYESDVRDVYKRQHLFYHLMESLKYNEYHYILYAEFSRCV